MVSALKANATNYRHIAAQRGKNLWMWKRWSSITFCLAKNRIWDPNSHFTLDQQMVSVLASTKCNKSPVFFSSLVGVWITGDHRREAPFWLLLPCRSIYTFRGGGKTFTKGRKQNFWSAEEFFFSRNIWEQNCFPFETKAQPSVIKIFQAFPIIFLTFVSLNILKSTFKKLLISDYEAGVKLTNPPTSLMGW